MDRTTTVARRAPPATRPRAKQPRRPAPPVERLPVHEAHVRALAIWVALAGALTGLPAVLSAVAAAGLGAPALLVGLLAGVGLLGLGLVVSGLGLWSFQGWARTNVALIGASLGGLQLLAVAAAGAEAVAIGRLLAEVGLAIPVGWALYGARGAAVFRPTYRRARGGPPVAWWRSPFLWGPAAFGAAFVGAAGLVTRALG